MSTCQGAPAPHRCDHGDACDWTPPEELAEKVRAMGRKPKVVDRAEELGLVGRARRALDGRKVRTPDRALAEIEKLETAGVTELGVAVFVWPKAVGRVTGHAVGCAECGAMPFLAPSRRAGHLAAARHVLHEHRGAGTVVLRDTAPHVKIGVSS